MLEVSLYVDRRVGKLRHAKNKFKELIPRLTFLITHSL